MHEGRSRHGNVPSFSSRLCCACPPFRLLTTPSREGAGQRSTCRQAYGRVNAIIAHLRAAKLGLGRALARSRRQEAPEVAAQNGIEICQIIASRRAARTLPAPTVKRLLRLDEQARRLCRRLSAVPRVSSLPLSRSWVGAIEFRNAGPAEWQSKLVLTKPLHGGKRP